MSGTLVRERMHEPNFSWLLFFTTTVVGYSWLGWARMQWKWLVPGDSCLGRQHAPARAQKGRIWWGWFNQSNAVVGGSAGRLKNCNYDGCSVGTRWALVDYFRKTKQWIEVGLGYLVVYGWPKYCFKVEAAWWLVHPVVCCSGVLSPIVTIYDDRVPPRIKG